MPRLKKIYEDYRLKGLNIVVVDTRGDRERGLKFIESEHLPYLFLQVTEDYRTVTTDLYRITAVPSTFILNSEKKIIFYHLGFTVGKELEIEENIVSLL